VSFLANFHLSVGRLSQHLFQFLPSNGKSKCFIAAFRVAKVDPLADLIGFSK
jgi:hypothetical protein